MAALVIRKAEPISMKVMILRALGLPEESVKNVTFIDHPYSIGFARTLTFLIGHHANALILIGVRRVAQLALAHGVAALDILGILFYIALGGLGARLSQLCKIATH